MSERKSMIQIAAELGVTRQTIYNRLKSKELAEAVKPFTTTEGCNKFYDIQAQELIKQAVLKDSLKVSKENFDNVVKDLQISNKNLDEVSKCLESTRKELENAHQTITRLQADNSDLQAENENLKAVKVEFDKCAIDYRLLEQKLDACEMLSAEKEKRIEGLTEQITSLESDKARLNERLDKAETNISNLTTALTAAQALHGMDKQQAAIEVKEDQKPSLFRRLFRKRSE